MSRLNQITNGAFLVVERYRGNMTGNGHRAAHSYSGSQGRQWSTTLTTVESWLVEDRQAQKIHCLSWLGLADVTPILCIPGSRSSRGSTKHWHCASQTSSHCLPSTLFHGSPKSQSVYLCDYTCGQPFPIRSRNPLESAKTKALEMGFPESVQHDQIPRHADLATDQLPISPRLLNRFILPVVLQST